MNRLIITLLAAGAMSTATGADAPLWLRDVAISPDGSTIAFTYKGSVFTVPVTGGRASQITSNSAYESSPVWSPDGSKLAFASNRANANADIFVVDATGGTPRRLTTNSAAETPMGWLNDSTILFSANYEPARQAAQTDFGRQIYSVPVGGGRPAMVSTITMQALSVAPDGRILYQDKKGYENVYRKHERSSSTGDVWLLDNGTYTRLTDFDGNDQNPVWTGSDSFIYLSEEDGTLNAYSRKLDGSDKRQLTSYTMHPVRSLSATPTGDRIAFSWNGEIYAATPGSEPAKVNVEIIADDYDLDHVMQTRTSGATAMAVSPDGKEVAFVIRGDIYVTSVEYTTTRRITDTPGQERCLSFSKDGRTLEIGRAHV